jgi:hypothetical protein
MPGVGAATHLVPEARFSGLFDRLDLAAESSLKEDKQERMADLSPQGYKPGLVKKCHTISK